MKQHDPYGTPMEAVAHYAAQGSPFVTVSVLERSLWVAAVQPEGRRLVERSSLLERARIGVAQIKVALENEAGR